MRAGIAGSGFAAEFHVAGLRGCAGLGVKPAAVYSPEAGRREAFAARHGLAAAAPVEEQLDDVYVVEKIGTKQGWSQPAPDEDWMHGYPQELAHFYACFANGTAPQCGAELGFVTTAVLYAAYRSAEQGGAEVPVAELPAAP